jgi:hypothetical protein
MLVFCYFVKALLIRVYVERVGEEADVSFCNAICVMFFFDNDFFFGGGGGGHIY